MSCYIGPLNSCWDYRKFTEPENSKDPWCNGYERMVVLGYMIMEKIRKLKL